MRIKSFILGAFCMAAMGVYAQNSFLFNGLNMDMGKTK